ncbi:hypothetical protein QZH56_37000 (plasmid) [Streptomyces olivoreticuli]|uniref:hypothetical protein n=1 Tax=Streptomyces olivoreticuli TaxID=68246 RepID=UPI00265B6CF4|nr:hypothetical protein [Streptomyces olivoreticuli]WKK27851.1 hypothetical protein QZH56_37000 [Streptomyces olivoreticuli]
MPDNPCDLAGPAGHYCKDGAHNAPSDPGGAPTDPLTALAGKCAEAAAWLTRHISKAMDAGPDLTSANFVRHYALVFAASTVLTIIVWLIAVTRRAINGAPVTRAISEAIGLLWMAVAVSAFAPLILHVIIGATDAVTKVIAQAAGNSSDPFAAMADALAHHKLGGGPFVWAAASGLTILLAGILWLAMALRTAGLYAGAVLGLLIFASLVNRRRWGSVHLWIGVMIALILTKPVLVAVVGVSGALTSGGSYSAIAAGLATMVVAILASLKVLRWVPSYSHSLVAARTAFNATRSAGRTAGAPVSAAAGVLRGVQAHADRKGGADRPPARPAPGNGVRDGISTHSTRPASKPPTGSSDTR